MNIWIELDGTMLRWQITRWERHIAWVCVYKAFDQNTPEKRPRVFALAAPPHISCQPISHPIDLGRVADNRFLNQLAAATAGTACLPRQRAVNHLVRPLACHNRGGSATGWRCDRLWTKRLTLLWDTQAGMGWYTHTHARTRSNFMSCDKTQEKS